MFEGNRDVLDELPVEAFPTDIGSAIGEERREAHPTVASYGGGASGAGPMYHGHGSRKTVPCRSFSPRWPESCRIRRTRSSGSRP
jgi:hypothetical protein